MRRPKRNKFVLGITGGIGSGKSTVASLFKDRHSLLIDADKLAHSLLTAQSSVLRRIRQYFGPQVLLRDNSVDRKKLAQIVFKDKAALLQLNRMVHPPLIRQIKKLIRDTDKRIIILDAALIVESGLKGLVDKLVVVTATKEQQINRSRQQLHLTRQQVEGRMKFQISQRAKARFADFIIDNSGRLSKTKQQVYQTRRQLWKS